MSKVNPTHQHTTLEPSTQGSTVRPEADGQSFRDAGVLGRAIRLFELIAESGPYRFSEIQTLSGLPKGTLHRLLNELCDERLISFEEKTNLYRAGFRVLEIANHVWSRSDIRSLASDQLLGLGALTNETVQLAVHSDTQMVIIDHVESQESVRLSISVGTQVPMYCTSLGKVMLAWCGQSQQDDILSRISFARLTANTITDIEALRQELNDISNRGYAIDSEEQFAGSASIAAPIVDHTGSAVASISVTAPTFRVSVEQMRQWREPLIASAAAISSRLAPRASTIPSASH